MAEICILHPGEREQIYQNLGERLTAVEPPLWTRLIAGFLLDRDVDLSIIDTEALALTPAQTAEQVIAEQPKLIAIVSFGHQPSASTQSMIAVRALATELKAQTDCPILVIGGHVAALPERTLTEEPVDYVCTGEGPHTVWQLYLYLSGKIDDREQVPDLMWQEGEQIIRTKRAALIQDLAEDLHGNVWHLLPMDKYRAHNWQCFGDLESRQPYASIYTTLGCPYQCVFCCINAPFNDHQYRCRDPQSVVDEIDLLYHQYGVKTFKIIDEMFVLKKSHYLKFCKLLAAKPYAEELNIWAYARIDTVQEETLATLRKAGIRWLALGIESADEQVRDGAKKSFGSKDIVDMVKMIQQADINVIGNFIFGLPYDSHQTMQKTLDLAIALQCEFVNFYSAMAYPGSLLYDQAIQYEWPLPADWGGYSQHSYECLPLPTASLSSREVLTFRDEAFHQYFSDTDYLALVTTKFGVETREHIKDMSAVRLKRELLEQPAPEMKANEQRIPVQIVAQ